MTTDCEWYTNHFGGKRVLITGASGFIGRHIAHRLSEFCETVLLDLSEFGETIPANSTFIRGDAGDTRVLEKIRGSLDYVFHFGSVSSIESMRNTPVESSSKAIHDFLTVLEFAKSRTVSCLVFPSSGTVYRSETGKSRRRLRPSNVYGLTKLVHEQVASAYSEHFSVRALRIFMGYGPGEERKGGIASPVCQFLVSALSDKPIILWGDGSQTRDLVFIDDVVDVCTRVTSLRGATVTFDVGLGTPVTFKELIDMVSEISGHKVQVISKPAPKSYVYSTRANPEKMRKVLEHEPVSAREGISRFARYLEGWKPD
jgi:UDP-glucose 4-epimerase